MIWISVVSLVVVGNGHTTMSNEKCSSLEAYTETNTWTSGAAIRKQLVQNEQWIKIQKWALTDDHNLRGLILAPNVTVRLKMTHFLIECWRGNVFFNDNLKQLIIYLYDLTTFSFELISLSRFVYCIKLVQK